MNDREAAIAAVVVERIEREAYLKGFANGVKFGRREEAFIANHKCPDEPHTHPFNDSEEVFCES